MSLTEPAIGVSLSPNWAQLLNADMGIIDSHNHAPGSGVQIPPSGLNINADLTMQGNNLTHINSLVFNGAVSGTPADLSLYTNGTDLYYTDIYGAAIQLTKNSGPNTSNGNIQGLPSTPDGNAGIAWLNSQSTFNFSNDVGTGQANIDIATLILRYPGSYPTPTGNYILLQAPTSLATGYALTLPASLPTNTSVLTVDSSGNVVASTQNSVNGSFTSSYSNTTTTSTTAVGATITVSGSRAVLLTLVGASGGQFSAYSNNTGVYQGVISIIKDGSEIYRYFFGGVSSNGSIAFQQIIPACSVSVVDPTPTAGSHTYQVNMYCGTNCIEVTANDISLLATEL